jgi:hypothetical protein
MARRTSSVSPHTRYQRARRKLSELEAQYVVIERSRPRTRGKKAVKTRRLNTLARALRVARGQLTKARNAIAHTASTRKAAKRTASQKRSKAAKQGWETRRARAKPTKPTPVSEGLFMPFLTEGGVVYVNPLGDHRKLVGSYWNAVHWFLATGHDAFLTPFEGVRIFDAETAKTFPFVTDTNIITEYVDELDFGAGFYKARNEINRFPT